MQHQKPLIHSKSKIENATPPGKSLFFNRNPSHEHHAHGEEGIQTNYQSKDGH